MLIVGDICWKKNIHDGGYLVRLVRKKVWSHKDDTNILKFGTNMFTILISQIFYD